METDDSIHIQLAKAIFNQIDDFAKENSLSPANIIEALMHAMACTIVANAKSYEIVDEICGQLRQGIDWYWKNDRETFEALRKEKPNP